MRINYMKRNHLKSIVIGSLIALPLLVLANGDDPDHAHDEPEAVMHMHEGASGYTEEADVRDGLSVNLTASPKSPLVKELTNLSFFVNEKPEGSPVTNLEIEHDKYIHVIGVRNDLNEFFHIHPVPKDGDPDSGIWEVGHIFDMPGTYKVWSDVRRDGQTHSFGHNLISVSGEGDVSVRDTEFLENVIVGDYQIALDHTQLIAQAEVEITFTVSDVVGRGVELEPFLAADMHLAIIKDDLNTYIHTHPHGETHDHSMRLVNTAYAHVEDTDEGSVEDNSLEKAVVSFSTVFPSAGVYKLFAQFRPKGIELPSDQSLVAEFYVQVAETEHFVGDGHTDHTHAPVSSVPWWQNPVWWLLFISSLVSMAILSFVVHRYLKD